MLAFNTQKIRGHVTIVLEKGAWPGSRPFLQNFCQGSCRDFSWEHVCQI